MTNVYGNFKRPKEIPVAVPRHDFVGVSVKMIIFAEEIIEANHNQQLQIKNRHIRIMRNRLAISLWTILTATLLLSSCSKEKIEINYMAAKLVDSDMWSIVDVRSGEIVYKDEFKSQPSTIVNDKFFVKGENGLYDYYTVDNVTKPINKEPFLYATAFNENDVALAVLKGKGISIINGKCEIVKDLDTSIRSAKLFCNGYSVVTDEDNKHGFVNEKGETVIKPKYDRASDFSEDGIAIVGNEVNDSVYKYFAIDRQGNELFAFSSSEYKDYSCFINGYLAVQKENDDVILLDKEGKKHGNIGKWKGFLPSWLGLNKNAIIFKDGESYGLKNSEGEIIIRAKYEDLYPLTGINPEYYLAKKQEKYGVIDKNDKIIIPFDYEILGYINDDVLFAGEGKSVSFMNKELKDIGQNNYTNLSFMDGYWVDSNYFNAENAARKIISNISVNTFFGTHKGMTLADFKDKLSGLKYADMDQSSIVDHDYPYTYLYGFDQNLSSMKYEYYYGYQFPSSPEYNYNANLIAVLATNSEYDRYQTDAEEKLAKAFETQIKKEGFKEVEGKPNWFESPDGLYVALGYNDGTVIVFGVYDPKLMDKLTLDRISRSEDKTEDNVEVDYIDTFGLDNVIEEDASEETTEAVEAVAEDW